MPEYKVAAASRGVVLCEHPGTIHSKEGEYNILWRRLEHRRRYPL